jgi:hypothetical protein
MKLSGLKLACRMPRLFRKAYYLPLSPRESATSYPLASIQIQSAATERRNDVQRCAAAYLSPSSSTRSLAPLSLLLTLPAGAHLPCHRRPETVRTAREI